MRHFSLRGWWLLVSMLFAVLGVGGIAVTSYFIVSDGMQMVADSTGERIAASGAAIFQQAIADASTEPTGTPSRQLEGASLTRLRDRLPPLLRSTGLLDAGFALYDADDELIWRSSTSAAHPEHRSQRGRSRGTGVATRSVTESHDILRGFLSEARLSTVVTHMPVKLPDGRVGILDVTYFPKSEEGVIDGIREPMTVLAISAILIMVVLMQGSMAWVLNLVNDLRRAADSIDAGRLDERLPDDARNEIGELARSLNRLIERLRRRSEAQVRFVGEASHELATPVAGIRGYSNILKEWGGEDETIRNEAIEAIDRESRRMARLTSDLLNLLHADQGLRLRKERFDLDVLIRERLAATMNRYIGKDLEFVGPESGAMIMIGDPGRMEDVVSILLDNAAKYTPPGGSISVSTRRKRELITMTVTDNGIGIPDDDVPLIFDRFFRSEKARIEGDPGFGLGLSMAKSVVESMGGSIDVETQYGEGATFRVVVPRGRM